MTKIILCGANGKMGRVISIKASELPDVQIVAGIDRETFLSFDYPVYASARTVSEPADVLIDFSHPSLLSELLCFAKERSLPIVLCTTGYSSQQQEQIRDASKEIPIFFSANMSVGVNLLSKLVKQAASVLYGDFDIEIIEKHHNQKLDSPSGTALMLADAAVKGAGQELGYAYDRHSIRKKRPKSEIGISSVRGGTIVGEHEVIFAGQDEIITLSHSALSKDIFGIGALRAAVFMGKITTPGIYSMEDCISL